MDIPARTVRDKGCLVPTTSELSKDLVQKLFDGVPEEETRLNILYCPLTLRLAMKNGVRSADTTIYPYWIPAVLERSGILEPPQNDTDIPWLIRGVLAPNEYQNSEYPVLSTVERVDTLGATLHILRDTWQSYLTGALDSFKAQTGSEIKNLCLEGWEVFTGQIALLPADLGGLTGSLVKFYDHYLHTEGQLPRVLQSLLTPRQKEPEAIIDPVGVILENPHYGQMSSRFPLSPSQRISLALMVKTEQVFAVNGPPGTGKTTLIQSIVADFLVKSFLSSGKPPLIVGSSANNKAITNILDSFASVSPSAAYRTGLNERWLPELNVLGHYLAANDQEKLDKAKDSGYWVTTSGKNGKDAYWAYCEAHPKSLCEEYFLEKYRALQKIDANVDLQSAYQAIKDTVIQFQSAIDHVVQHSRALREFIKEYKLEEIKLADLGGTIETQISSLRENRTFLEALIQREHLRPQRLGFVSKMVERLRFGEPSIRRSRLQSELIRRSDLSINLELPNFYELAAQVWKFREQFFQEEFKLTKSWGKTKTCYSELQPYRAALDPEVSCGSEEWIKEIQGQLDQRERHEAFWWALHGLECQWLRQRNDNDYRALNGGPDQSVGRWEQRTFLTPVFVATFHSLPKFFSYSKKLPQGSWINPPLSDFIDLLVIDEAGQVTPELGIPVFGLAKKAVVVGDVQQLEPIWNIPSEPIDFSNCRRAEIIRQQQDYEGFARSRRSSVNGSLMVLAQDASESLYPPQWNEAGSLLIEHRRCAPEIIEFCNRFVYQSLLDIKTSSVKSEWPALGYCHVGGESAKFRGSQANFVEARAIATWIQKNKQELIKNSAQLADVLAIVTPFKGQQTVIIDALKERNVYEPAMVVGTVHSLQGSEKPLVIFSPVYGRNHLSGPLFFNQSYNMLNVAISRAKNHFFVFGNMALFKPNEFKTPAGDLGSLLFKSQDNEIKNEFLFTENQIAFFDQEPIDRISDLQKHRMALKKALETAEKRLVIVSPFISQTALQADNIPELVALTVKRNVEVIILTDDCLDLVQGALKPQSEAGRKALIDAGATLRVLSGVHNKTVIIDRRVLIEGSFNWLSAVRDETSQYHRMETSIVLKAPYGERFIVRAENELGL
jgi:ABC-type uncharacterized transport system YnjBCD ATPase subunit